MAVNRVPCLVPGCVCTISRRRLGKWTEWICERHWSAVRRNRRRVYHRYRRLANRPDGGRHIPACVAVWNQLKKEAIERAVGL